MMRRCDETRFIDIEALESGLELYPVNRQHISEDQIKPSTVSYENSQKACPHSRDIYTLCLLSLRLPERFRASGSPPSRSG